MHPLKILLILILLFNFHFEIFGIKVNDEQFSKISKEEYSNFPNDSSSSKDNNDI